MTVFTLSLSCGVVVSVMSFWCSDSNFEMKIGELDMLSQPDRYVPKTFWLTSIPGGKLLSFQAERKKGLEKEGIISKNVPRKGTFLERCIYIFSY